MNLADLFKLATLIDAVNKLPVSPSKIGSSGLFRERGITTTAVIIDEQQGRLSLVPNVSRNGEAVPALKPGRKRRTFTTTHLPLSATILPEDLQGIAAFGEENVSASQAQVINDRLESLKASIEVTREWQRLGAIKGQILDADGTVLYDLFTEFGVTKKALTVAFSAAGDIRPKLLEAKRHAESKLTGQVVQGWRCYCSSEFMDALTAHASVQKAFANYQEAADRLGGDNRAGFVFGGIEFIEYEATVGSTRFIAANKAHLFPVLPAAFCMVNAPANYNETVNTLGKPWYAKAEERRLGKGWDLEVQANPLALCLFPEALVELTAG